MLEISIHEHIPVFIGLYTISSNPLEQQFSTPLCPHIKAVE